MTHANAPFTPTGRERLARLIVEDGWSVRRAAERFQSSPATASKWAARYRAGESTTDRSSRPATSPNRLPSRTESRIIGLRFSHRWGPHRVAFHLGGYFVTAQEMASNLQNTFVSDWINPQDNETRPELTAADFVRGRNTLSSLSKEGVGTAGHLVTALTAATLEAATDLAAVSAGGRMQTPLVAIMDEAANVCRWPVLPDLYSHFGSRDIPIMSVFQSYSQGVAVFGKEGMEKLRSASNVFIYAGGVREASTRAATRVCGPRRRR